MIRTLIEVSAENSWEHKGQLVDVLGKLGFEPKRDEEYGRFMNDLMSELADRGLRPDILVEERRARREAQWKQPGTADANDVPKATE